MAAAKKRKRVKRGSSPSKLPRHKTARDIGRARARKRTAADIPPPSSSGSADGLVRLNKLLADHGVASRRKCDEMIAKGKISVDGEPVTRLGTKIDPDRRVVEVDGVLIKGSRRRYYLLNKPAGVVCTNETREMRPRAVDLITDRDKGRIYTVGRLDEESLGLILLTNDGDFANRVMHPRYGVDKTYSVRVGGRIDDEALKTIRSGVHLAEGRTAGARILMRSRGRENSTLDVTLREGMNREIRRVFARVGFKVLTLRRTRIGPLNARGLKVGSWRPLRRGEVEELLEWTPEKAEEYAERSAVRKPARKRTTKKHTTKRPATKKRATGTRKVAKKQAATRKTVSKRGAGSRKVTGKRAPRARGDR